MENFKNTTGKRIGYVRVSSVDQNDARQLDGLQLEKLFSDKCSGKDTNRPQLLLMRDYVREGDTVYVHSMDRLSRSLMDLQTLVEYFVQKGVSLIFIKENLTFAPHDPNNSDAHQSIYSTLMLQLLGAVAQFERSLIKARQMEGILLAKQAKKYKGRKPLDKTKQAQIVQMANDGMAKIDIAARLDISRATVYLYIKAAKR